MNCKYVGKKLIPCLTLARSLEFTNLTARSRGVYLPERESSKTGKRPPDFIQIHSGEFVGRGAVAKFCPFCGEKIVFIEKHEA